MKLKVNVISEMMRERDITQVMIAERLGITQTAVSKILKTGQAKQHNVEQLAAYFGLAMNDIVDISIQPGTNIPDAVAKLERADVIIDRLLKDIQKLERENEQLRRGVIPE